MTTSKIYQEDIGYDTDTIAKQQVMSQQQHKNRKKAHYKDSSMLSIVSFQRFVLTA